MSENPTLPGARLAIVLSAGDSRRIGRPKALLTISGESFLARIDRQFRTAGFDRVAVVVGGRHAEEIRGAAETLGIEMIANPDPSDGPISSVRSALARHPDRDLYAIHPVDIPGVEAEDIVALLTCVSEPDGEHGEHGDVWIPSIRHRRAHPVVFRPRMVERILGLPAGATLRDAWSSPDVRITHVPLRNAWLRFDIDTKEDFETLQRDWIAN